MMIMFNLFSLVLMVLFNLFFSRKLMWSYMLVLFSFILILNVFLFPVYFNKIGAAYYIDYLSFFLVYLTIFILILMITSSNSIYKYNAMPGYFMLMMTMLFMSLYMSFLSLSAFSFYFFFEFSLVPTMLLIMGWGYQIERIQATTYFLMYTLIASLPLLILISKVDYMNGSFNFINIFHYSLGIFSNKTSLSFMIFFAGVASFLAKLPMFMTHLWLPKAHVEAPVSGSMILAGVLLKLGGYGLIRFAITLKILFSMFSYIIISISILSLFFISLACIRSNDLKSLVAYSSVAHMGISLAGLMTLSVYGAMGSVLMLLGHGVCSSGLFSYINMNYERSSSRSMLVNKGVMSYSTGAGLFMFLLTVINLGAPPTMNLFSELFLVTSLIFFSTTSILLLLLGSFFVAIYSMILFSSSHHGKFYSCLTLFSSMKEIEYFTLFSHCMPLCVSFLLMNLIM